MTHQTFLDGKIELYGGDNRDVLKNFPDNHFSSIVCDPPYALVSIQKRFGVANAKPTKDGDVYARASAGFMGKQWDTGEVAFSEVFWAECLRVLKPGGHVVAFSGTRTYHRMAVAIEDAGFEIRDDILEMFTTERPAETFLNSLNDEQRSAFARLLDDTQFTGLLGWAYGSGFPKSHDVSKAIDKAAGAERTEVIGTTKSGISNKNGVAGNGTTWDRVAVNVDVTAPATDAAREWQGWGTALKPAWEPICLARKPLTGTVAENVLEHGTGALNIDGCRIHAGDAQEGRKRHGGGIAENHTSFVLPDSDHASPAGRWPANIVHDGSDEVLAAFPDAGGGYGKRGGNPDSTSYGFAEGTMQTVGFGDSGSAARFFYTAKADKLDRIGSKHPTVKPVDLMQWLCRLVTPPGGLVLDPFAGSGSTGEAAWREGFRAILIEREEEYQADIAERLRLADKGPATRRAKAIKQADNDNLPLFGGVEATGGGTR